MRNVFLVLFLAGFLWFAPAVSAQVGDVNDPNGYKISQKEFQEYTAAVENCETPSLECLVRYTTRFVAMEWVNEIMGADNKIVEQAGAEGKPVARGGVINGMAQVIGSMYTYPIADTRTYVADVMESANLAPKAYAQGLGFASLNPILGLWKAFRNIAYFFFIFLFIVIGFMIMFRQKISGQVAVTAQQAIPSVVISLVLVTFSYAIAGFMIDLMYLIMFMIVGVFTDVLRTQIGNTAGESLINMNIVQLGGTLLSAVWGKTDVAQNLINDIIANIQGQSEGTGISQFTGMLGGLTISLVIAIAVLINLFKLFFELLKSYFAVVVAVVTAPIVLMIGAIPGKNVFMPWLKNIIGNLAAFPTVLLVVVMFLQFTGGGTTQGGFMPPFLIGSGQSGMIGPLLGFATLLALPEIVKKVKESLGATQGGMFFDLGKSAWSNAQAGWSGKGLGGWGAKRIATLPLVGAGAAAGYGYAQGRANELQLRGKARFATLAGGTLAGAGIGANLPRAASSLGKRTMGQFADTEIKKALKDFGLASQELEKSKQEQEQQQAINSQENAIPATSTQQKARGTSQRKINDLQ